MADSNLREFERLVPRGEVNPNTGIAYESLENVITSHLRDIGPIPVEIYMDGCEIGGKIAAVTLNNTIGDVISCSDETVVVSLNEMGQSYQQKGLYDRAKIQFCFLGDMKQDNVVKIIKASLVYM